jgi:GNAT superfamily N-acetyltransferase
MDVTVRPMRPDDAETVAVLSHQLGYPATAADIVRRLAAMERRGAAQVFVAETPDRQIVGWIHVYGVYLLEADAYGEVGGLVVAEHVRGKGVGARLLAAAEAWAADDYPTVRVRSNVTRTAAHRFYERVGYQRDKTQHNFQKSLSGPS